MLLIEELRPYLPQLADLMKSLSLEGALADIGDYDFASGSEAHGGLDMSGGDAGGGGGGD